MKARTQKAAVKKISSKKNDFNDKVVVHAMPAVHNFGTNQAIATSIEKSQINSIDVQFNGKNVPIFADGKFVEGAHPNLAQFVLHAVIGGLGTGRGARQLGFADWVNTVSEKFSELGFSKPPQNYSVIANFSKRGGIMVYPLNKLIELCKIKAEAARVSFEMFPRQIALPKARGTKEETTAVVKYNL